jgi:hypothetical protein
MLTTLILPCRGVLFFLGVDSAFDSYYIVISIYNS